MLGTPNPYEYYAATRIKIHLGNTLYQITAVRLDDEPELVIADSLLIIITPGMVLWETLYPAGHSPRVKQ